MNDLVSIIIPCYNQADYLPETLESIIQQTYPDWEAIIVNDGSPDNTEEIALQYTQKDSRFKYYKKENGGLSSARNYGIHRANGKYIIPLDSDDLIAPTFIEKGINFFHSNPEYTLFCCLAQFFGARDGVLEARYTGYKELLISNSIVCTSMFKKDDCIKIGGYDENNRIGFEDWEFYIRLLYKDQKVYQIPEPLFLYRIRQGTMTASCNQKENKDFIYQYIYRRHLDKYLEYFENPIAILQKNEYYKSKLQKYYNKWYRKVFYSIFRKK